MFKYIICAFIAAIILPNLALAVDFRQCRNGSPSPTEVRIPGCDVQPCTFVHMDPYHLELDFVVTDTTATTTLRPQVFIYFLSLTIPYTIPEDRLDACEDLFVGTCPLSAGETVSYMIDLPIESPFDNISAGFEFSLVGDNDVVVSCFEIDVIIVTPAIE